MLNEKLPFGTKPEPQRTSLWVLLLMQTDGNTCFDYYMNIPGRDLPAYLESRILQGAAIFWKAAGAPAERTQCSKDPQPNAGKTIAGTGCYDQKNQEATASSLVLPEKDST